MKPTALVVTTVHRPDDTRIRERLIRSLAKDFRVRYAAPSPGPADRSGLEYVELAGARWRRNVAAARHAVGGDWDVLVLHDPEILIAGWLARLLRRRPVVFDVHEDYPELARTRAWVPPWLRGPLSWLVRLALAVTERLLTVTLAEAGYRGIFRGEQPVFPNHPDTSAYPEVTEERRSEAVYVGDVTEARGIQVAIEACERAGVPLRLIGRTSSELALRLSERESDGGVIAGGELPNPRAIEAAGGASVGLAPLLDLPNYRHSQPTKILEYLAMGVPVAASDLPGTRSLVEGLEAVALAVPGDAGSLASAIEAAMSPEILASAIDQAPRVRKRFSWPDEEVRAFYRSLL